MINKTNPAVLVLLLMFSAIILLPSSSPAYQNEVKGTIGTGSGDSATTDVKLRGFEIEYNRFFTDVKAGDYPYGVSEFLQHPSYLGGGIQTASSKTEDKLGFDSAEADAFFTKVGGMYYIRGGDTATGLGLTISSGEVETDYYFGGFWAGAEDEDVKRFTFRANQYLKKDLRLEFSIADEKLDGSDTGGGAWEYDQRIVSIGASALLQNKFWLSGRLFNGERDYELALDEDIEGFEFTGGFYPNQKIGVFLHLEKETFDAGPSEEETSTMAVEGDFYFNENMHLDAMLSLINIDPSPGVNDIDLTVLEITFGYMF